MAASIAGVIEDFCLNFMRGIVDNVSMVKRLVENEAEQPSTPSQDKPAQTELARRRAERKRLSSKEELPETTSVKKKKTVRGMLWWMVKTNLVFTVMLMVGMTHLVVPVLAWILGDLWTVNSVLETAVGSMLLTMWMIPLFLLTKIVNTFWMNDLSNLAYKQSQGRPVQSDPTLFFSDLVYSTVLQLLFLIQICVFSLIPVTVGGFNVLELILTSISYAMYAFEYKWMNMGYEVRKRLDLVDKNFAFHVGFGFPLSFIVLYSHNFWVRFILNSFLFPALILCANYATEPKNVRGRGTYIFYPAEKVTVVFFEFLQKFGLRSTLMALLGLVGVVVLYWLGVVGVVWSVLGAVVGLVPDLGLYELFLQLVRSVKGWFS